MKKTLGIFGTGGLLPVGGAGVAACVLAAAAVAQTTFTPVIIKQPEPQPAPTRFGQSVCVTPDMTGDGVPDLAIGDLFFDQGEQTETGIPVNVGTVFVMNGATHEVLHRLNDYDHGIALTDQQFAQFGNVSSLGDVTNDGVVDFVVGAGFRDFTEEGYGIGVGQSYAVNGADGSLLFYIDDPAREAFGRFGWAVVGLADANGDGTGDAAVSTPFKDANGFRDVGEVYVYSGVDGTVIKHIQNPFPEHGAWFGWTMADGGDMNLDLLSDPIVGAPGQNYVYVLLGDDLLAVTPPISQPGAWFGAAVAGAYDVTGDSIPDFLVGAPRYNVSGREDQGRAYVYNGLTGALIRTIDHPDPQAFSNFGGTVAMTADLSGDSVADLMIAAPAHDAGGHMNGGQVYIFSGADGSLLFTLDNPKAEPFAAFGSTLMSADMNGDGLADPIIAAPLQDQYTAPGELFEDDICGALRLDQGIVVVFMSEGN